MPDSLYTDPIGTCRLCTLMLLSKQIKQTSIRLYACMLVCLITLSSWSACLICLSKHWDTACCATSQSTKSEMDVKLVILFSGQWQYKMTQIGLSQKSLAEGIQETPSTLNTLSSDQSELLVQLRFPEIHQRTCRAEVVSGILHRPLGNWTAPTALRARFVLKRSSITQ